MIWLAVFVVAVSSLAGLGSPKGDDVSDRTANPPETPCRTIDGKPIEHRRAHWPGYPDDFCMFCNAQWPA